MSDPFADIPDVPPPLAAANPADPFKDIPPFNPYADLEHKAPPKPIYNASDFDPKQFADPEAWKRNLGLAARGVISGVVSIPALVGDTVTSLYNLGDRATGGEGGLQLPSSKMAQELDAAGLPSPKGFVENAANFGYGALGGAAVPIPTAAVPKNFVSPADTERQMMADFLKKSSDAGLKVPPSTVNPSFKNLVLETIAGKQATQQGAQAANQAARKRMASEALGLNPDAPLTPEAIATVKAESGKAWEAARALPAVKTDQTFLDDMTNVLKEHHGANESFPGSSNPDVEKMVDTYLVPEFTGNSAVSAVKLLRSKADDAFRNGQSESGRAYKAISAAIESQSERAAEALGGDAAKIVPNLRAARQRYAVASSIDEAMSDSMGNISGGKLAAMWRRGEPLTGPLSLAAEHAAAFPKANLPANSSPVSHVDSYATMLAAMLGEHASGSPWGLAAGAAVPALRYGAKGLLLRDGAQTLPEAGSALPKDLIAALLKGSYGAQSASQ